LFDEGSNSTIFGERPKGFVFDESGNQERVLLAAFQIRSHLPKNLLAFPPKTVFVTSTQLAPSLL
jgi:hypothetical protein